MELQTRIENLKKSADALKVRLDKFNSCHSPASGEFCSTGSGGGGGGAAAAGAHAGALTSANPKTEGEHKAASQAHFKAAEEYFKEAQRQFRSGVKGGDAAGKKFTRLAREHTRLGTHHSNQAATAPKQ